MRFSRSTLFVFSALAMLAATPAFAARDARPTLADSRVRTVMYQPDEVFKFTGHYGFQSSIEFAADETIQTISMGDSSAWLLQPSGNRLFLKPIEQGATTNMTVLTDKHTYLFELHGREAQAIDDQEMTFVLRFLYPGAEGGGKDDVVKNYVDSVPLPELDENPGRFNFNYTISGPEDISPIRIFDDGEFTYFEFRGRNTELPAFFLVYSDNSEALINYRTRGQYIVVERVGPRFTLRHGPRVVCVFNESFKRQLMPPGRSRAEPAAPPAR